MARPLWDVARRLAVAAAVAASLLGTAAVPALAEVPAESQFVLNSLSFLFHGVLVMWMSAGFAMLEAGLVRTKNTATIRLKNVAIYAIAGIAYYLAGYSLMYVDVAGVAGSLSLLYNASEAELSPIGADDETAALIEPVTGNGYAVMSDWFFQMVFVGTAASIVSGTLAERA
jgi:Amt family ammonium transporter